MSRRKLRPDELELWQRVARTTERLHPARPEQKPVRPAAKPNPREPVQKMPVERFTVGERANGTTAGEHDVLPGLSDRLAAAPLRMDRKAFGKLKRGKLKPEGRIDLHGMTLDQARPALISFIMSSFARERRLVLVITGKGKDRGEDGPIPVRRGVLRHNVPHWLSVPPLSPLVLQVTPAHVSHGGGGAYYVYLRRLR